MNTGLLDKLLKHLKTIRNHKKYVRKACWKMGLFWQGVMHDLSKYSITELKICKYYTGKKSPHQVCRDEIGYSPSWISHFHKNKHHWEFWIEDNDVGKFYGIKMPFKYVVESVCDMLGASKAYNKDNWQPQMLWDYWIAKCEGKRIQHKESLCLTRFLIWNLYQMGEEHFYAWYKENKVELKRLYDEGSIVEWVKNINNI